VLVDAITSVAKAAPAKMPALRLRKPSDLATIIFMPQFLKQRICSKMP
jgi:hypothetical protein